MQLLKEWPWHRKFGKSLILAWLSFSSVSHIPYYVNFRFINGPNISSVLECFLRQLGRYTYKSFFAELFCVYVFEKCVKDFNGSQTINDSFERFYILCPTKAIPANFDN